MQAIVFAALLAVAAANSIAYVPTAYNTPVVAAPGYTTGYNGYPYAAINQYAVNPYVYNTVAAKNVLGAKTIVPAVNYAYGASVPVSTVVAAGTPAATYKTVSPVAYNAAGYYPYNYNTGYGYVPTTQYGYTNQYVY